MENVQIKISTILGMLDFFGKEQIIEILGDVQSGKVSIQKLEEFIASNMSEKNSCCE